MKRSLLLVVAMFFAVSGFAAKESQSPSSDQEQKEIKIAITPTDRLKSKNWRARYEEKLKQAKELGPKAKILFLGDSITHFWEREDYGKEVFERDFKQYNTFDAGISGDRTEHLLWIIEKSGILDPLDPQLIVLMIGTNNAGHQLKRKGGTGVQATVAGTRRALNDLRARFPKAKILLFAIFPRGKDAQDAARIQNQKVNNITRRLADNENIFWVDINDKLMNPDGTIDTEVMPDRVHPRKKGYEIWSAAIMPYVKQYVK